MILFRDEDILRYLHNEMAYNELADFEAVLDSQVELQDRFEEILDELAYLHEIESAISDDVLKEIITFAKFNTKTDNSKATRQALYHCLY